MKHIKQVTACTLSALLLSSALAAALPAAASDVYTDNDTEALSASVTPRHGAPVSVTLNGSTILDGEAQIIGSTTYVPLRKFCNAQG